MMSSKTRKGKTKPGVRRQYPVVDWERRRQIKDRFDSLSPEEHDRELKKLSSEDLFFLVADTIRATHNI